MPRADRWGAERSFELLEGRALLGAQPLIYEQYFPEGFASDSINEYVPMTNTNGISCTFELWAKYEVGARDQLIASGTIPANTRGGVTISDVAHPGETLVRKNEPYALVVKSDQPLAATMSHYDFGTAVGETFTSTTATVWTFGDGRKSASLSRDYILVYNPGSDPVDATITLYAEDGTTTTDFRTIEPERRSGWSIQDISSMHDGIFAAKVTATAPIVASQSHYELETKRGYGVVGTPSAGSLAGVIPSIEFDDHFYETNGDDPGGGAHYSADAFISLVNTNNAPATVTLTFFIDRSGSGDPRVVRVALVPGNGRTRLSIRDLGISDTEEFGIVFRSNVPVTMTASVYQGQDGTGVMAQTLAANEWNFGEGFMSAARAGGQIQEHIYLFNPTAAETDVTISFMFTDGTTLVLNRSLDGLDLEDVKVHEIAELLGRAPDQWYGIRVESTALIVASMEHWDGGIGGGFATFGMPGINTAEIANILAL